MPAVLGYRSYAKINLYLDVLNKRRDGFNNIETIFHTVSLYDALSLEACRSGISLTCSVPDLETGEGNLVYRAAALLQKYTGCRKGVRMHLEKNIPIAAGLAGGSGNAAAALVGLNSLWKLALPDRVIQRLALHLGSDVPYCTVGGAAAATRRGEAMESLHALKKTWVVLINPPIAISAGHTYNHPALGRNHQNPFNGKTAAFRTALDRYETGDLAGLVFNQMETPVLVDHPQLTTVKERLLDAGCIAAAVSGSGPTLFGIAPTKTIATRAATAVPEYRSWVTHTVSKGVEAVK